MRIVDALRQEGWRIGLYVVLVFGCLQGYFLWHIYVEPVALQHELSFEGAEWLSPGDEGPHGFYRREIIVSEKVKLAWIQISASDSYRLFINGNVIATKKFVSSSVSDIYDLSTLLNQGKNIVAVMVQRQSYPGASRVAVKGGYLDQANQEHVFVSDRSWKASSFEESQGGGEFLWYQEEFRTTRWHNANAVGLVQQGEASTVAINPDLLRSLPQGSWIWHPDPTVLSVYFQKSFSLPVRMEEAWIRIAADKRYELLINGVKIGEKDRFGNSFDLYEITKLLRPGQNSIGIGVRSDQVVHGLLADLYLFDGKRGWFEVKSDSTWQVSLPSLSGQSGLSSSDVEGSGWRAARPLASYSAQPWGLLRQSLTDVSLPSTYSGQSMTKFFFFLVMCAGITVGIWLLSSLLLTFLTGHSFSLMAARDAILHLPSSLLLVLAYLLKYDIRFDPAYPFRIQFVFVPIFILFTLRVLLFLEGWLQKRSIKWRIPPLEFQMKAGYRGAILITLLMFSGGFIRMEGLDAKSLDHDEIGMVVQAKGVLTKGYPYKMVGVREKPLTTYEIAPYPLALSMKLFGASDHSARLSSVIFGILTILLLYIVGQDMFDMRTGLFAALIYTFSPWAINWAQNAFYPQQVQLAALLTSYLFFKAMTADPLDRRYIYGTAGLFIVTYLSWEGSGLLLPVFFIALLVIKGKDLSWFKSREVWYSMVLIFLVVFWQQLRRLYHRTPYLIVGSGAAGILGPSLFFLDPMYDPYFYLKNFLFLENHVVLTLLLILGIPYLFKHRGLRYFYLLLGSLLFIMTNLVSNMATRYAYYFQPFLIICAAAAGIYFIDTIRVFVQRLSSRISSSVAFIFALSFIALVFFASNAMLLNLYRFSSSPTQPIGQSRLGIHSMTDYKSINRMVSSLIQENDLVILGMPHTYEYYTGEKNDYTLNFDIMRQMTYDISGKFPGFLDKYAGSPSIRSYAELRDVVERHKRVWIIGAPSLRLGVLTEEEKISQYIRTYFKVVYETYDAELYLYEH